MTYKNILILFSLSLNSPDHSLAISQISDSCLYSYFNSSAFNQSVVSADFENSFLNQELILNCLNKLDFNRSAIRTCLSSSYFNESLILNGLADVCCNLKDALPNYLLIYFLLVLEVYGGIKAALRRRFLGKIYSNARDFGRDVVGLRLDERNLKKIIIEAHDLSNIQLDDFRVIIVEIDELVAAINRIGDRARRDNIYNMLYLRRSTIKDKIHFKKISQATPRLLFLDEGTSNRASEALIKEVGLSALMTVTFVMMLVKHHKGHVSFANIADLDPIPLYRMIFFCYFYTAARRLIRYCLRYCPRIYLMIPNAVFACPLLWPLKENTTPLITLKTMLDVFIYSIPFGLALIPVYFERFTLKELAKKNRFFALIAKVIYFNATSEFAIAIFDGLYFLVFYILICVLFGTGILH